jgi:transcriptional regulator with XRE-family HTH domain
MRYDLATSDVARLVREARVRQGLSQRRLALRAGTSQAAISRIERGLEAPSTKRLRDLLLVLGRSAVVEAEPLRGLDPDPSG